MATSSTQQLNQSLADLVSWSNNVLLFGLTAGQTATEVVNGVRNAVAVSGGRGGLTGRVASGRGWAGTAERTPTADAKFGSLS